MKAFFDTSTWSRLQDSRGQSNESTIRQFATERQLTILVTQELIEELPPGESGARRLTFMQNFPQTHFVEETAWNVMQGCCRALTALAAQVPPTPVQLHAKPLQSFDSHELRSRVVVGRGTRFARSLMATAQRMQRKAGQLTSKSGREKENKLVAALLQGDVEEFQKHAPPNNPVGVFLQPLVVRLGQIYAKTTERFGFPLMIGKTLDPIFVLYLLPAFDRDVRLSPGLLLKIVKLWSTADFSKPSDEVSQFASPLACVAAVRDSVRRNLARNYEDSEELDHLHAVFAPFVDVFTADKRTVDALTSGRKTRRPAPRTVLLRGDRLEEIVDALKRHSSEQAK